MGEHDRVLLVPRRVEYAVNSSGRYSAEEAQLIWQDMWFLNCQNVCKAHARIRAVCVLIASAVYAYMLGAINPDPSVLIGLLAMSTGLLIATRVNRYVRLQSFKRQRTKFRASSEVFWSGVDEHLYGPDGVYSKYERGDPKVNIVVQRPFPGG